MMPPHTPRSALVVIPLVAIFIVTRASVLPQSRPTSLNPLLDTTNTHSHQLIDPTLDITATNKRALQLSTQRLVRGEERSPPLKSILRQSGDTEASDGLDDFFSSLQPLPPTPVPDEPRTPNPESTPDEVNEIQLEEQVQPSPFDTGPVIIVDAENATSNEQSEDRDVGRPTAVDADVEFSASPEMEEAGDDNGLMGTRGQTISTAQGVELQIDSSEESVNPNLAEEAIEEDEPEPSPSVTDSGSIFEALSSIMDDSSESKPDDNTDEPRASTPAPSDASADGSDEPAAPIADTAPQNETSRVQVDISVRSTSLTTVSPDLDTYVRAYLASETVTAPANWKPVFVSAAEEIEERGVTFFVWALKYQGILSSSDINGDVKRLQERIFSGELEAFLRSSLATDSISVQLFNEIQRDVQDEPEVPIEDIGAVSAEGQPTSNENAATGGEPARSESRNDANGNDRRRNLWLVLGTCLGFVAVVGLVVAAFVLAKRSSNSPRHTIDGEEIAPPTLTSFQSISTTDSTPSRFQTGAPVNPRGATMLQNQSRLLDWRAEQAAAADRESRVEILE